MNPENYAKLCAVPLKRLETDDAPQNGIVVSVNDFCVRKFKEGPTCLEFYRSLIGQPAGYYRCPFGFSAYRTEAGGEAVALTSVIPLPRDHNNRDAKEDQRLKDYRESAIERKAIDRAAASLQVLKAVFEDMEKEAQQKLPHALHEIRKLNAAIKAESEDLYKRTNNHSALTVFRASEFMSTQFELLDGLINESITLLPLTHKSGIDGLVHKCVKIFESRAEQKQVRIDFAERKHVSVNCCDKTLPIIVTILLDNAIRYAPDKSTVKVRVTQDGGQAVLTVENTGDMKLPEDRMFKKHERGDTNMEGSGFGLYFAKKIAEQHEGDLLCDARGGQVVFRFSLPVRK
jgi:signal transduction histidine kinase